MDPSRYWKVLYKLHVIKDTPNIYTHSNGNIKEIRFSIQLEFDNNPNKHFACRLWSKKGTKKYEKYYTDGKLNNLTISLPFQEKEENKIIAPAATGWHKNGVKSHEEYYTNGELNDPDLLSYSLLGNEKKRMIIPALTIWYTNGNKEYITHCINGKLHSPGLASASFLLTKKKEEKEKIMPAIIFWYINGTKKFEAYYDHDTLINRIDFLY